MRSPRLLPMVPPAACAGPAPLDVRPFEEEELTIDEVLPIADAINPQLAIERKNVDPATAAIWEKRLTWRRCPTSTPLRSNWRSSPV